MMTKFSILIFILITNLTFCQVFKNGLILPDKNKDEKNCCIYVPKNGFKIYDDKGKLIGTLTRNVKQNKGDQSAYRIYFVSTSSKKEELIEIDNFKEIGYEVWALTYNQINGDFVKLDILEKNYWINISETQNAGFKLTNWQKFFSDMTGILLGFYPNEPGLNLRNEPDANSKLIRTLKGDVCQISLTKENKGLWSKVKVIVTKENPCGTDLTEEENIIEEIEGWIKIVDDEGKPNLWYYSRGC